MVHQYNNVLTIFTLNTNQFLPNKHPDTDINNTH